MGSRGSVIPLYISKMQTGEEMPVTDERMTRFWITRADAVEMVLKALQLAKGRDFRAKEPKHENHRFGDGDRAWTGNPYIGIRPGEKLYEVMITTEDSRHTIDIGQYFVILPETFNREQIGGICREAASRYSSDFNKNWLAMSELRELLTKEGFGPGN